MASHVYILLYTENNRFYYGLQLKDISCCHACMTTAADQWKFILKNALTTRIHLFLVMGTMRMMQDGWGEGCGRTSELGTTGSIGGVSAT